MRHLEIWMFGFVASVVVAMVLAMSSGRATKPASEDPAKEERGPDRMQLRPKVKPHSVRYALAYDRMAS